jgi:hypothetical protein
VPSAWRPSTRPTAKRRWAAPRPQPRAGLPPASPPSSTHSRARRGWCRPRSRARGPPRASLIGAAIPTASRWPIIAPGMAVTAAYAARIAIGARAIRCRPCAGRPLRCSGAVSGMSCPTASSAYTMGAAWRTGARHVPCASVDNGSASRPRRLHGSNPAPWSGCGSGPASTSPKVRPAALGPWGAIRCPCLTGLVRSREAPQRCQPGARHDLALDASAPHLSPPRMGRRGPKGALRVRSVWDLRWASDALALGLPRCASRGMSTPISCLWVPLHPHGGC